MIQSIYVGTLRLPHWPWVGEYNAYFPAGESYCFRAGTFLRPVIRDLIGNGGTGAGRSYKHMKHMGTLGGIWGAGCDKMHGGGGS